MGVAVFGGGGWSVKLPGNNFFLMMFWFLIYSPSATRESCLFKLLTARNKFNAFSAKGFTLRWLRGGTLCDLGIFGRACLFPWLCNMKGSLSSTVLHDNGGKLLVWAWVPAFNCCKGVPALHVSSKIPKWLSPSALLPKHEGNKHLEPIAWTKIRQGKTTVVLTDFKQCQNN